MIKKETFLLLQLSSSEQDCSSWTIILSYEDWCWRSITLWRIHHIGSVMDLYEIANPSTLLSLDLLLNKHAAFSDDPKAAVGQWWWAHWRPDSIDPVIKERSQQSLYKDHSQHSDTLKTDAVWVNEYTPCTPPRVYIRTVYFSMCK